MNMNATATALPDELASSGHLFRVDSRGKYIPAASSASKGGIYHFELSKDLENRVLPNGRKVIEQVVNLETTDYEKAIERAKSLIMERKAMSVMKSGKVLNSADLITESIKSADPDGGSAERVWDRFAKSDAYAKKAETSKNNAKSSFMLLEKYVNGKSFYDFNSEDAAKFVAEILKTHSPSSLQKVYLPTYREIWNVSLPLIANPWYDCVKWDDFRKMLVVSGCGAEVGPDMSLAAFSEEYFRREASSGRKWERNTEGFMRHFTSHMGVKTVGEVTQEIAMEYARRMVEDPAMRVNRSGRDRLSKFKTMWAMLLPDTKNPWENACYDVAVREFPKKETKVKPTAADCPEMPEVGFASSSQCFHCTSPERLWSEYVARHAMKPRRESTARSMFMRLWRETGLNSPKQIVTSVAEQYCRDTLSKKRSAQDDLIVLRLVWETIMPGVKNPWPINISRDVDKIRYPSELAAPKKDETPSEKPAEEKEELPLPEVLDSAKPEISESVSETSSVNQVVENTVEAPEIKPDRITFDRMYEIWKEKSEGKYSKATYRSYHTRLRRLAGWMLRRGVSEIGPDDIGIDIAREYLDYLRTQINVLSGDISVIRIMWDAAWPESRCRNPWKPIFEEVSAIEYRPEQPEARGWLSRFARWIRGLFR